MPRYGGYDSDLEEDDDQLPEGCLHMSKLRSIARAIKRQHLQEMTGMSQTARKHNKAKAAAIRQAMADKKKKEDTEAMLKKIAGDIPVTVNTPPMCAAVTVS